METAQKPVYVVSIWLGSRTRGGHDLGKVRESGSRPGAIENRVLWLGSLDSGSRLTIPGRNSSICILRALIGICHDLAFADMKSPSRRNVKNDGLVAWEARLGNGLNNPL
ncbi:hypothetical protein CRG98_004243 [Punica granatum]|uniref:Uncharacterized protein n=1 Tax=Punica granatum TaxID=22663 RepID=A0A2I0L3R9_PUNGR|nr:hypothetical protein CRG98_004243 [Punica granatum]